MVVWATLGCFDLLTSGRAIPFQIVLQPPFPAPSSVLAARLVAYLDGTAIALDAGNLRIGDVGPGQPASHAGIYEIGVCISGLDKDLARANRPGQLDKVQSRSALRGHHDRVHCDAFVAAFSISRATGSGCDTITTCEAPLMTTVSRE